MTLLTQIEQHLFRKQGERDLLNKRLSIEREKAAALESRQAAATEALEIVQTVAKLTQQELEIHISELVSMALEAVFPNPYKLTLTFVSRRNRSEADIALVDADGNSVSPMDAVGGGVVDVAAFALRVAMLALVRPRPAQVLIMDEPFRFLSRDLQPKASAMMKELADKMGLQFILVSHEENLLEAADKVFEVSIRNGVSEVKED